MENYTQELHTVGEMLMLGSLLAEAVQADYESSRRRWWVKEINKSRKEQGAVNNLVQQMRQEDDEAFFDFTRMTISRFDCLLNLVSPRLEKYSMRESLTPETRLLITLR